VKKILIYGHKSFIAKNFIHDYSKKYDLFFFKKRFNKSIKFEKLIIKFIKKNNIKYIINFAANNDNSIYSKNFNEIIQSNFNLAVKFIEISKKLNLTLFLFSSKDMNKSYSIQNFYSISKLMLQSFLENCGSDIKVRILNLDSIYGPQDFNFKRIIPSIILKILAKKRNLNKINFNQKKNFTYVKDVNKLISKLLNNNKKHIYKEMPSKRYYIDDLYTYLKDLDFNFNEKTYKYKSFVETLKWYKDHYESKK